MALECGEIISVKMFPGFLLDPGKVRGTDRNRRDSNTLSPVLIHFVAPHGKLLQRLLALEHLLGSVPPLLTSQQHAGPRQPHYGIPPEVWSNVVRHVIEHHESLHQVATGDARVP